MRSISYNGNLKRDIDFTRRKFDFKRENKKSFIRSGFVSTILGISIGLFSCNLLLAGLALTGTFFVGAGVGLIKNDIKSKKIVKEKTKIYKKMWEFVDNIDSETILTPKCLENAQISQDYFTYKNLIGEEERQEVRNYYISDRNGQILMLTEMKNELATLIIDGQINASLEITNGSSLINVDNSYGLFVMDGSEYDNVESKKTMALTIRK